MSKGTAVLLTPVVVGMHILLVVLAARILVVRRCLITRRVPLPVGARVVSLSGMLGMFMLGRCMMRRGMLGRRRLRKRRLLRCVAVLPILLLATPGTPAPTMRGPALTVMRRTFDWGKCSWCGRCNRESCCWRLLFRRLLLRRLLRGLLRNLLRWLSKLKTCFLRGRVAGLR
jgi:hypothetical protein